MAVQQEISAQRLQRKVGSEVDVIVDEVSGEAAVGRTKGDAPEIDGLVYLKNTDGLAPGDVVRRRVTKADDYDLWTD
jgi:ribosomal protein S12 methylthiotransferase